MTSRSRSSPSTNNVVDSAAAGRRLLDEIRSPRLRVVIDLANLFDGPDLDQQGETLREAFELLGDDVVLAHAEGVQRGGAIVAAGRGDLDYDVYVALLGRSGLGVPLIMHGLAESEVPEGVAFLQAVLSRTPVR
jgi:sugar phosphate isomerase/epimerase